MNAHGIFICYKRSHKHLAGRIYDFFLNKGLNPFMDEYSLVQTLNYNDDIETEIKNSPYFLCLLTEDGVNDLVSGNTDSKYYQEIQIAFRYKDRLHIRVIPYGDIDYYRDLADLPDEIAELCNITIDNLPPSNRQFYSYMEDFYAKNIDLKIISERVDWKNIIHYRSNVLMQARADIEKDFTSFDSRFGKEFVDCVRENKEFNGPYIIQEVNLACYAASVLFAPSKDLVDRYAYDYGMMFNIFARLLEDKDFNLRIITTVPDSEAAAEAVKYEKIGNSSMEDREEIVFYVSYSNLIKLLQNEPYKSSEEKKRFHYYLSDCSLPYSIFHVVYKDGWKHFNHVKVDLYSFGLDSSTERRSLIFFENDKDSKDNYDFFVNQFKYLKRKSKKYSSSQFEEKREEWLKKCDELEYDI